MQKDVIYIDVEDDITGIIGKVKAAENKIVALVPPKRIGVLQSAVNLKLLQKAASGVEKRVVLITNDHSLIALASGVNMPVAKNLQSKPEVPQVLPPKSNEEEIIDGEALPVGDFASRIGLDAALKRNRTKADEIGEKVELGEVAISTKVDAPNGAKTKNKLKVPDFNSFRKKLFLIGGAIVVLAIFIVWATVFAPRASVTIMARTTALNVNRALILDSNLAKSEPENLKLKPVVNEVKKSVSYEFDATGTKDVGDKASGTVTVRNCDFSDDFVLAAGTKFTSASGAVFVSTQEVTVPDFSGPSSACTQSGSSSGKVTVAIQASQIGPEYNIEAQAYSISGYSAKVDGVGSNMSGGTKETVKVVTEDDVSKARQQLPKQDQDAARQELEKIFQTGQIIITESFEAIQAGEVVSPKVNDQATRAKITQETTFKLTGLQRDDIDLIIHKFVDDNLKDKPNQQAYQYGEDSISFQIYQKVNDNSATTRLITAAYVGPKIDTNQLAKQLQGKRFGEIQAIVTQISGVEDVQIKLSPFWVTKAPKADKIEVKFNIQENDG